jgi:hypothetical protein
MDRIAQLLADQDGLISRVQALDGGLNRVQIARLLRRKEWIVVHPGVYIEHNGSLSWHQRAWSAVLYAWPAALTHDSALRAAHGPGRRTDRDDRPIQVAVDRHRHLARRAGIRFRRSGGFEERVQWNLSPPRVRYEEAVLDVAAEKADPVASVGVLADACGSRRSTAARLLIRLEARERVAQRAWLSAVLTDVAEGTCSVLEHGYQGLVVRPHDLPAGELQSTGVRAGGRVYRDVELKELGMYIELDGRLFHTSAADRDRDLERDLDAAVERDATTLRLGFGQVYKRSCATARKVAVVMTRHGWTGELRPCDQCGAEDEPG